MRIVFLTGIWPPDVGGPATHGPEFSRFLTGRGHRVVVVTMGDGEPTVRPCEVVTVSRSSPFPVRYTRVALTATRKALRADVVYATATYAAAAAASRAARTPLAVKLVSDPAYERATRYGLFEGTLEEFQQPGSGSRAELLKRLRTSVLGRARAIVAPSVYLAEIAVAWGLERQRVTVLPNPAPAIDVTPAPLEPGTFVFVGRLTLQKALDVAIVAVAAVPAARLLVVGDGPDRSRLEEVARAIGVEGRVTFLGARPREEALGLVAGARAALLTSAWENFPHSVVEALSVGVPVVSTAVGGVSEIVRDGENGLLVEAGASHAVAAAMTRLLDEPGLRDRLAAASRASVARLSTEIVYGELEQILAGIAHA
jgi:glycosyltransferase involved in cell wall biosynthesis